MNKSIIIKAFWFVTCLAVLSFAYEAGDVHDADILFIYSLLALTFPIGLLVQVIIFISVAIFDLSYPGGFTGNFLFWVFAVGLGYWQWFIALPWLLNRMKTANQSLKRTG